MLKIFDERIILDKVVEGELVRPSQSCFLLIQKGTIELEVNSLRTTYQSSELILFSPMKMYKLIHCSEHLKAYFILYKQEALKERINVSFNKFSVIQLMNMEQSKVSYSLSKEAFSHFWNIAKQLDFYLKNPDYSKFNEQVVIHNFTVIVYMVVDAIMKNNPLNIEQNTRKEAIVISFLDLLSSHFTRERELKFYADKLFISIKYLSVCVKEVTGIAPRVLIANTLLDEAKLKLTTTELNISIIADQLNFSDQYAFGKFFKKHTGLSPRNFRKNIASANTI
ncbi:AraC family transcriptional regulator [Aequorivita sp. F47161]|uniref:AraC family transcriptional regulator n=1 Tax=Aequorivita vitellina TaxID=2874475 RepID=A0A9X1QUT7_9FLAO|nr:AraC family transcriptional regulator [Aequorivita vitellina]MCG2418755.1 AraC family transcriptional regulator [Aequorivita vitellina]